MCGIAGFLGSDAEGIRRATRALAHRGPDDEGYHVDEVVSLGHRRLSILDLTPAGHQPMFYAREAGASSATHAPEQCAAAPLAIVYNGEIYNYLDVREQLERLGYRFSTRCDTEVILAAYQEWGTSCLQHFNGMWAFCLYDRRRRQLVLARDRMGIKPLYLHAQGGRFVFGSEVKVILEVLGRQPLDADSLRHYAALGFTPPDRTMLEGIEKLRPGEVLVFDLDTRSVLKREFYWRVPWPAQAPAEPGPDPAPELRRLLGDAVKRRLLADVPVGAFLSGGVDSSIVVALMRPHVRDLKTFSVRFDHPDYDETLWSRQMADRLGTDHYELPFGAEDVRALLPRLPEFYDDPLGDPSMVPTYLVSQVARRHVTVSLSGTGGDELFAGYPRYREYQLLRLLRRLPRAAGRLLCALLARSDADRARKLDGLLRAPDESQLYALLFSHRFREHGAAPLDVARWPALRRPPFAGDPLRALLDFDQTLYLPEALLVKEDRASMAHGLEARVPFIDYTVVTFANGLHHRWKLRGRSGKDVLKRAFADVLPAEIASRPKRGFGFPLEHYLRAELHDTAREVLFDAGMQGVCDRREVEFLWEAHQSGRSNYAHALWCQLVFNLWYQRWCR